MEVGAGAALPERKWTDHTDEFCPAFEEVYDEAYKKSILKLHRNVREDNLYRVVLCIFAAGRLEHMARGI